jgi:glycosyltransferase involved in cell wall biosynthesis
MDELSISVIVTTYQRPANLQRALASLAVQRGVWGRYEVIVADDGSLDETGDIVARFARQVTFPVQWVTHPHDGFHAARSRNEGARAASAPYLVYLDGDCIAPRDHLAAYQARRRAGEILAGDAFFIDRETSAQITTQRVLAGTVVPRPTAQERRRVARRHRRYLLDGWWRALGWRQATEKPGFKSVNFGLERRVYEAINGFDENFRGWGCEDDDFGARLRQAGFRIRSIMRRSPLFHLWHPPAATVPARWKDNVNRDYFRRPGRLARCRNGLNKRPLRELQVRLAGRPRDPQVVMRMLSAWLPALPVASSPSQPAAEVEIVAVPGQGSFSRRAECRLLLVLEDCPEARQLARRADRVVWNNPPAPHRRAQTYELPQLGEALESIT